MRPRDAITSMWVIALVMNCATYKILVIFPYPAGSHNILGRGVVRHLLKAGHQVTYITPYPTNNTNPQLREIDVTDNFNALNVGLINIKSLMKKRSELNPGRIFHLMMNVTKRTMGNVNVVNLLNDRRERFDVVISQWMFNEVFSGIATLYDCPHIWFSIHEPGFAILSLIDEATNPAYTASVDLEAIAPFTFLQRLKSLQLQVNCMLRYYLIYRNIEKEVFDKTFAPILARRNKTLPSYEKVRLNASLIFGTYHVSLAQAIRLPQNYIPVGGQHIEEDFKPLPKEINKIMNEAKNGVIYFSMGSTLKSKDLPESIKRDLLKLLAEFEQTVIWKFEDTLPNLPENVHILPWAPQQSILSHPRCVLFINHGGLLSTMEAVHFAVPFVGIPVYYDQQLNMEKAVTKGISIKVELTDRVAEDLKKAVNEMLSNSKYRERIKELSFVYHHRPVPPGRELVHWVEHVVRTGGAQHLRSPALLVPWYQKMYLDLALILLILTVFAIYSIRLCLSQLKEKTKMKLS